MIRSYGNFINGKFDLEGSRHDLRSPADGSVIASITMGSREKTLEAMLQALRIGGRIFLSFPCEQSVEFPKRGGTLNYYDDQTHKFSPPDFAKITGKFEQLGFQLDHAVKNYSPKIYWIIGLIQEPISKFRNKVMRGTWPYYGFESIIIATKTKSTRSSS